MLTRKAEQGNQHRSFAEYNMDVVMISSGAYTVRKLGERNWSNAARNRDSWQQLLKKALAQKGLLCQ